MSEAEQIQNFLGDVDPTCKNCGFAEWRHEDRHPCKQFVSKVQPTHLVDGELREEIEHLRKCYYNHVSPDDGTRYDGFGSMNSELFVSNLLKCFAAHLQAAVREARKEERHLLQRELDNLRQFQESVIERDMLKTAPIVLCAGCSKQLTQSNPKPKKEK